MVIPLQTHFQSSGCDGCLLPTWLRQAVQSKGAYLCEFSESYQERLHSGCWEQRYPKMVLEESFTNLLELQWDHFFSPFHVVLRDNLYVLTLGSKESLRSNQPWYQGALQKVRCTPPHGVEVTRVLQVERRPEIRLCPELPPLAAVSVWIWKGRLFYLSLPCFLSLMQSLLETGVGYDRKRQCCGYSSPGGLQVRGMCWMQCQWVVCIRVGFYPLLSKHVLSHFDVLPYVFASFLAVFSLCEWFIFKCPCK